MKEAKVEDLSTDETREQLRMLEALLFAASEPLDTETLLDRLPGTPDIEMLISNLQSAYAHRGINLVRVAEGFAFRTAPDLAYLLERYTTVPKTLSRVAMETLSIIAYHQPVTRAEIEEIRGVSTSKGTLDILLETEWVRMRGRRRSPGRPVTYGTTRQFLNHFGLEVIGDLPGVDELKGAGLLDSRLPADFRVPTPRDDADLFDDEEPLEDDPDEAERSAETGPSAVEDALDAAFEVHDKPAGM